MIKKDIAYGINSKTGNDVFLSDNIGSSQSTELDKQLSSVDLIFDEADSEMREQNQKYTKLKNKKNKKKRRHPLLKIIVAIIITIVVVVGALFYFGVQTINSAIPEVKEQLIESLITSRRELESVDEATLDVDSYYMRQVLLLLTEEEIRDAVNQLSNVELLINGSNGNFGIEDIIPNDKIEQFKKIEAEYEKAKAESASQSNGSIENADLKNESVNTNETETINSIEQTQQTEQYKQTE